MSLRQILVSLQNLQNSKTLGFWAFALTTFSAKFALGHLGSGTILWSKSWHSFHNFRTCWKLDFKQKTVSANPQFWEPENASETWAIAIQSLELWLWQSATRDWLLTPLRFGTSVNILFGRTNTFCSKVLGHVLCNFGVLATSGKLQEMRWFKTPTN